VPKQNVIAAATGERPDRKRQGAMLGFKLSEALVTTMSWIDVERIEV
jgi:hypothetical protein